MGKRQKRQEHIIRISRYHFQNGLTIPQNVMMGQHHTFWPSSGSRGINNGRELIGIRGMVIHCRNRIRQPVRYLAENNLFFSFGFHGTFKVEDMPQVRKIGLVRRQVLPVFHAVHQHDLAA